jgi:hypothetical protein
MKITVDLDLSRRTKRALGLGLGLALLVGGGAVAYAGGLHVWKPMDPLTADDLNNNFANLDGRITALPKVVAASAERTGNIPPKTAAWTTIPGLTVTFTLGQTSLVQATGNGVQRTTTETASSICRAAYRYVVDGVAKGNPTFGQRINTSDGATAWHATWSAIDFNSLGPGSHTIELQASLLDPGYGSCYICAEADGVLYEHDSCTLNVVAIPQ